MSRLLAVLGCLGLPLLLAYADSSPLPAGAIRFHLKDADGRSVSLSDFQDKKAVVIVFTGTQCPLNNAYMPTLAALCREYAPRRAQFLAVNANSNDTAAQVAEHARKNALPFPVLKDADGAVAERLGARRTPEAFVLDERRVVRYRGRIDDQFGIGYKRSRPTRRDLAVALDEVLAGKPVSRSTTPVAGCRIARRVSGQAGAVTFTRDVSRVLQRSCQECHRPGQAGPMSLLTYDDAAAWAASIREVVAEGRMPPWHADPRFGHFANDRRLPEADRRTLLAWIDQGTPRGDDRDLPPPRRWPGGWTIGRPDLVVSMLTTFNVPAEMPPGGVPYQHFWVDSGFREDRWIERAEIRAGAPAVVHHVVVFVVPPGARFFPGNPETPALAGTAPGDTALILRPGTAKRVPAGSRFVFEMHYTPNGIAQKDCTGMGLIFAPGPPDRVVYTEPIANPAFRIPPGDGNFKVEAWFRFQEDGHILGLMPHMHLRGKDFLYEAVYPDGRREVLLSVPRFDFNWQSVYQLAQPHPMPKGSRVHCVAHYDNSSRNPNNPNPERTVYWGDQTWEEMMIGWMDYAYEGK